MANILIADLNLTGLDLLQDQENFLDELSDTEIETITGGNKWNIPNNGISTMKVGGSSNFVALSVYPPRVICLPC